MDWWFHPDELSILRSSIERELNCVLPDARGMERHPFVQLAQTNPVFLVDGKIYAAVDGKHSGSYFEQKKFFGTKKMRVEEVGDFDSIDDLFFKRAHLKIKEAEVKYTKKIIQDTKLDQLIKPATDTANLIIKTIYPNLKNGVHEEKLSELLSDDEDVTTSDPVFVRRRLTPEEFREIQEKREKVKAKLEENIEYLLELAGISELNREHSANKTAYESRLDTIFLSKENCDDEFESPLNLAFKDRPIAIINNKVYDLVRTELDECKQSLNIEGRRFALNKTKKTLEIEEKNYYTKFISLLRVHTVMTQLDENKILNDLDSFENEQIDAASLDEHRIENFGFIRYARDYYAFLEVPEFAIKSQMDGKHYLFRKARVGIRVWNNGSNLKYSEQIVMIDNNNHPFLHNKRSNYAKLCLGNQAFPTSGKDTGDVVAKRLRRCKEMLMFGYTHKKYAECYELRKCILCNYNHFRDNLVEESYLKEKQIPIIRGGPRK